MQYPPLLWGTQAPAREDLIIPPSLPELRGQYHYSGFTDKDSEEKRSTVVPISTAMGPEAQGPLCPKAHSLGPECERPEKAAVDNDNPQVCFYWQMLLHVLKVQAKLETLINVLIKRPQF